MTPPPSSGVLDDARRILLVRLDNVGDVVLLGAAARELRRAFPEARLTLLGTPAGEHAAPLLPWIDEVIVHRPIWQDLHGSPELGTASERRLVERLTAGRFDAAVIFTSFSQSPDAAAYASLLAGIPVRIGHRAAFSGRVLDPAVDPPPLATHQAERSLHLLDAVGVPIASRDPGIEVPPAADAAVARLLAAHGIADGTPFALLAPGASCTARRARPELLVRVADRIARDGVPIVLAGGERDAAATAPIAAATRSVDLTGQTTVPELAALAGRAGVAITMNSAPLHLADALAAALVALYSGTDLESQWAPRRSPARLFRRPTDCAPCYALECPFDVACLALDPAEIADAALALLPPTTTPACLETAWTASAS